MSQHFFFCFINSCNNVTISNICRQKKIRPLPVRLLAGYPLKKYLRIFLKPAGTRE